MNEHYLDNIYMYGAQAKDIFLAYPYFQSNYDDITHNDYPENLYAYLKNNSLYEIPAGATPEHGRIRETVRKRAKSSKFPLLIYLSVLVVLEALTMIALIVKGKAEIKNMFLVGFGILILVGLPLGITLLLIGASKRDKNLYKDMERALSSDIFFLKEGMAVLVHGYDYPDYNKVHDPVGQFMPIDKFNAKLADDRSFNIYKYESGYDARYDRVFPFNQAFLLKNIKNREHDTQNGLLYITADCYIYSLIRPVIGYAHMATDTPSRRAIFSKYFNYVSGYRSDVRIVLPDIRNPYFS